MEVTRSNFVSVLPLLEQQIHNSDFIAFDTELTGLTTHKNQRYFLLDDIQQRYSKIRDSAINFALIQFGIAIFTWSAKKQKFLVDSYSFYLFPPSTPNFQERKFTVQVSSIAFLAENKFDFNKTFYKGIPFLSRKEEQQMRDHRLCQSQAASQSERVLIDIDAKPEDCRFIKETCLLIDGWLEKGAKSVLELPPCNSYQRLLIYQQVELRYTDPTLKVKKKMVNGNVFCTIEIATTGNKAEDNAKDSEQFEKEIDDLVGFRRVIDILIDAKKPLVGHNCLMDFCHTYQKFVEFLPPNVAEFKQNLAELFPRVVDTKHIALCTEKVRLDVQSTSLDTLLDYFRSSKIRPPLIESSDIKVQLHDAEVYALFYKLEANMRLGHASRDEFMSAFLDESLHDKLHLMRSDFAFMSISGEERMRLLCPLVITFPNVAQPDRSCFCVIENIGKGASTAKLEETLKAYSPFEIIGVDDNAAYVRFESAEKMTAFCTQLPESGLKLQAVAYEDRYST